MVATANPLSEEELMRMLEKGETDQVAFFPNNAKAVDVAETLCAMANVHGGYVMLGVDSRGHVQPDNDVDRLTEIAQRASMALEPQLALSSIKSVAHERGLVLLAHVPAGATRIYSLSGAFLKRSGATNRPLAMDELQRLLHERGDTGFESKVLDELSLVDLDMTRVLNYLESQPFMTIEDVPAALQVKGCAGPVRKSNGDISGMAPTVAGLLLFGRNPQQTIRSAEIICVRYAGQAMGDEFIRQDVQGCLPDQIRQAEAFILSNMKRDVRIQALEREENVEYPVAVVREAIVNAVAHRDYSIRGEGIRILLFSDRLEVYSPGRLPGHVTVDNLMDERYSRNEAIVSVLSDMGYIERLGYGIDRMISTMAERNLPPPTFEETAAGFKVILRSVEHRETETATSARTSFAIALNDRQQTALAYVQERGRITNSEYQQLVPDVSAETIRRDLADLVEKNLLLRIGEKRATYYILK